MRFNLPLIAALGAAGIALSACQGGIGIGSIMGLEVGSPPTVQETQLLGEINARLESLEKQANELVSSHALAAPDLNTLAGVENEAKQAVDALRRDPRDAGERLAAQNTLTKYENTIKAMQGK